MSIEALVEQLKKSDLGRIYWANFCMQHQIGILDLNKSKAIFGKAANDKDYVEQVAAISTYGVGDASQAALMALVKHTQENEEAIASCHASTDSANLPDVVSTVLSTHTFVDHCLSPAGRIALTAEWVRLLPTSVGSRHPSGDAAELALRSLPTVGVKGIKSLPHSSSFLQPTIVIRTRYQRFWMAGDPNSFPNEADAVRDLLALGYLKPGDGLVRISLPKPVLLNALGAHAEPTARRPSVFCVNDLVAPRFRGRHSEETAGPRAVRDSGMTVNLAGGIVPLDGTNEWICPQIVVNAEHLHVELLGEVRHLTSTPSNFQFADYLSDYGSITASVEQLALQQLTN